MTFFSDWGDMQDRYSGDIGDFLKFGLLRHLTSGSGSARPLRLGVVWYRTPDEAHNDDGKHIRYLQPGYRNAAHLRGLDPDLYDKLASMIDTGARSIPAMEGLGLVPNETAYFNDVLSFADLPVVAVEARRQRRIDWVERATAATAECDVVFLDPDNGIRPSGHRVPRHRTRAIKSAYLDELLPYAARGQSVVIYHHADRSAVVAEQATRRLADVARELPLKPMAAVLASRGTTRLFLVAASDGNAAQLEARLRALEDTPWRGELRVLWAA